MKSIFLIICLSMIVKAEDFPLSADDVAEIKSSLRQWCEIAEDQGSLGDSEYIDKLGMGLGKTSELAPYTVGDRIGTHKAIQRKLLSIDGHAEYFGNKITSHYGSIKRRYAAGQKGIPWWHFDTESMYAFRTLSLLPSHETVHVLGEMLSDGWRPPYWDEEFNFVPLKERAVSALSKLPIANPPTKQLHHAGDMREYVDDWGKWYAEIKAGHRTFRFIGDDTEYDLRGQVKRGGFGRTDRSGKRNTPDVETEKPPTLQKQSHEI